MTWAPAIIWCICVPLIALGAGSVYVDYQRTRKRFNRRNEKYLQRHGTRYPH